MVLALAPRTETPNVAGLVLLGLLEAALAGVAAWWSWCLATDRAPYMLDADGIHDGRGLLIRWHEVNGVRRVRHRRTFPTALRLYDGSGLRASMKTWMLRGGERKVLALVGRFSPRVTEMMAAT